MATVRKLLNAESDGQVLSEFDQSLVLLILMFAILFLMLAWRWRAVLFQGCFRSVNGGTSAPPPPGLRSSALQLLPSATYTAKVAEDTKDCAICLTEFADGDLTRALPQCSHMFHVVCVDKWLKTHSSCPSCRQLVTVNSKSSASAASHKV